MLRLFIFCQGVGVAYPYHGALCKIIAIMILMRKETHHNTWFILFFLDIVRPALYLSTNQFDIRSCAGKNEMENFTFQY